MTHGRMISPERERIEKRLRAEVCAACVERRADGTCNLNENLHCPLFQRLDEVIDVIGGVSDYSVEPYHERVRDIICSTCRANRSGHCKPREQLDCALENYFPLIVSIVEKELYSKS